MKITRVRSVFSGNNHYVVVETDEGIRGLGEATLNTRQLAVEGALRHMEAYLKGKDPLRSAFLWQDVFRGTFWRGGPVLQAALSGVDLALWDIKGKALNVPVYQLLGGKCRDKVRLYKGIGGRDERQAGQALEQGVTPDALLTDVEQAMAALGELTGRTVREDITSRIFQRFCVGK